MSGRLIGPVAAAMLVFACDGAGPFGESDARREQPAAPALDPGLLVGRWSERTDCKSWFEFRAGGELATWDGGEGRWALAGQRLTLSGGSGRAQVRLRSLDSEEMIAVNDAGAVAVSRRC